MRLIRPQLSLFANIKIMLLLSRFLQKKKIPQAIFYQRVTFPENVKLSSPRTSVTKFLDIQQRCFPKRHLLLKNWKCYDACWIWSHFTAVFPLQWVKSLPGNDGIPSYIGDIDNNRFMRANVVNLWLNTGILCDFNLGR